MAKKPPNRGGWFECPDESGKAPEHKAAANKNNMMGILRVPMKRLKPEGYKAHKIIINELQEVTIQIGHFPTSQELRRINKEGLIARIFRHGGINHFRTELGQKLIKKSKDYWSDEIIVSELKPIIIKIAHFPTRDELINLNRGDLAGAIATKGGYNKFQNLLGYEAQRKPKDYWADETVIAELEPIIELFGYFPTMEELRAKERRDLASQIAIHGGVNKFKKLMGYHITKKDNGSWTDEIIVYELEQITKTLGHFPTRKELISIGRIDLTGAITRHGGANKFRGLCEKPIIQRTKGYWTDATIISGIRLIAMKLNHFPMVAELKNEGRGDLQAQITNHGGANKFRMLMGYPISQYDEYISELMTYVGRRGKRSEGIIKQILTGWAHLHNLPDPTYNNRLAQGNVIEFICNVGRNIGIDVTNTESKKAVSDKWRKKKYYKYLDELWIVVFSDSFSDTDYDRWNKESPENVKVMTIQDFLEELDYPIDEATKCKIDRYCKCTFRTKDEFIKRHLNRSIDDYV
ncbi:MAG: hypothetical protein PHW62_00250 [Candidatus Ratteibacteria bacterium]|nr:hypothetical protein [Candidatus Ratteibacteria bacterium]